MERLNSSPHNQYAAFDFFVTAEHIIDWLYPDDRRKREEVRASSEILRITSHIANGAKHFEAKARHHQSVAGVEKSRYVAKGYVQEGYFKEPIIIHLSSQESEALGRASLEATELAELVYNYWSSNA